MKQKLQLENLGSLITIAGTNECLGDLMAFDGRGVYDPTYGKVDVTPEQAKIHNGLLDTARLEGLDKNCEIGQGGTFYKINGQVQTFLGTFVASPVVNGQSIMFARAGKMYRGRLQKDADCFNFKRVS